MAGPMISVPENTTCQVDSLVTWTGPFCPSGDGPGPVCPSRSLDRTHLSFPLFGPDPSVFLRVVTGPICLSGCLDRPCLTFSREKSGEAYRETYRERETNREGAYRKHIGKDDKSPQLWCPAPVPVWTNTEHIRNYLIRGFGRLCVRQQRRTVRTIAMSTFFCLKPPL